MCVAAYMLHTYLSAVFYLYYAYNSAPCSEAPARQSVTSRPNDELWRTRPPPNLSAPVPVTWRAASNPNCTTWSPDARPPVRADGSARRERLPPMSSGWPPVRVRRPGLAQTGRDAPRTGRERASFAGDVDFLGAPRTEKAGGAGSSWRSEEIRSVSGIRRICTLSL